ncbi:MAG: hypothetical protein AB7V48_00565 [Sedimentibacter sp.]
MHPNLRGDWYLVQVNSLPQNDVYAIASDIHLDRYIKILDGTLVRYSNDEIMNLSDIKHGLKDVIDSLENRVYSFLLFDNQNKFLFKGQPLIFIVDPPINRSQFPYHRHLNHGYLRVFTEKDDKKMENSFQFLNESNYSYHHVLNYQVIPESVCYIHDVKELDVPGYCRQEVAYATMACYAFRNEIFIKYFEVYGEFFWLGPGTPFPSFAEGHLLSVGQENICHCGSKASYKDCHFRNDFKEYIGRIKNLNVTEQMVIETQKHFTYHSNKLLKKIVDLINNS